MAGVRVVYTDHLQCLATKRDHCIGVIQDFHACPREASCNFFRARPMIMISQHSDNWRREGLQHLLKLVEILLTVTNEVACDDHQIGFLSIGHRRSVELGLQRRDPSHVLVRQVHHTQMRKLLLKADWPRKMSECYLGISQQSLRVPKALERTLDCFKDAVRRREHLFTITLLELFVIRNLVILQCYCTWPHASGL